jgi:hypothetical protein
MPSRKPAGARKRCELTQGQRAGSDALRARFGGLAGPISQRTGDSRPPARSGTCAACLATRAANRSTRRNESYDTLAIGRVRRAARRGGVSVVRPLPVHPHRRSRGHADRSNLRVVVLHAVPAVASDSTTNPLRNSKTKMASEPEDDKKGNDLGWGLSITVLLTAASYTITYVALMARATYFHIPLDYITVGPTQIAEVGAVLVYLCSPLLFAWLPLHILGGPDVSSRWSKVYVALTLAVLSGVCVLFAAAKDAQAPTLTWLLRAGYFGLPIGCAILYIHLSRSKGKDSRYRFMLSVPFTMIVATNFACAGAYYMGKSSAASQTDFDLIKDNPLCQYEVGPVNGLVY